MPTFATGSRTQLAYLVESTYGVTPAGNGKKLRCTDTTGLAYAVSYTNSSEVRSDRQVSGSTLTGASAAGPIPFEMSYREYDAFLEAVTQGTWGAQNKWDGTSGTAWGSDGVGAAIPTSATFALDTDHDKLTAGLATSTTSLFTNLAKGQWVRISGSTVAGQNKIVQVSKTVAPSSTVLHFEGTPFTGAYGDGGAAVKINTYRLTNGTTQRSFTIEREHADITQFFSFRGMTASKMSMSFSSGALATGSFDFMGKDSVRGTSTTLGTRTESNTYDIMNSVAGVGNIYEAGVPLTSTSIKTLSFDLDNGLYGNEAIGTLGAVNIGAGSCTVSGSMEVFLTDGSLYDKFIGDVGTSMSWSVVDTAGNGYVFTLPNVKFKDAKITGGTLNSAAMLSVGFDAHMDAALLKTIIIDRVGNGV